MRCQGCGNNIFDNAAVCPYCGRTTGAAPVQPAAPAAKSGISPAIAALIAVLSVMLLTSCFLLFIKPGYLIKKDTLPAETAAETQPAAPSQTPAAETEPPEVTGEERIQHQADTKPIIKDLPGLITEPVNTEEHSTNSKKKTTTTTTTSTTAATATTTAAGNGSTEEDNRAYSEAMNYSTDQRPTIDEFGWIYGQSGFIYTPPGYAEMLTDPLSFFGGWKCMVILNPTNSNGTYARSWGNMSIGVYNGSAECTIDWYMDGVDYSEMFENPTPDSHFYGDATAGSITAEGTDGTVTIEYFWKYDGAEYAIGAYTTADGLPTYIALVRP